MTYRNRVLAPLSALLLAIGSAGFFATSAAADGDNSAIAENTENGSSLFRLAFSIQRVTDEVVDNQNLAIAYAKCESCRTVAIAIQILIVASDPDVVTPTNVAIAVNDECVLCVTLASAYQFVLGGQERLHLTGRGRGELQRIRQELSRLGKEDLPPTEIQARTDVLMDEVRGVLDRELVVRGPDEVGEGRDEEGDQGTAEEGADGPGQDSEPESITQPRTTTEPESPASTTPEPTETDRSGDGTTQENR